jgi:hypothetical protein
VKTLFLILALPLSQEEARAAERQAAIDTISRRGGLVRPDLVVLPSRPSKKDFALLQLFPKIRSLSAHGSLGLKADAFAPLKELTQLKFLVLTQLSIGEGMKYLDGMNDLLELDLTGSWVRDDQLRHIEGCTRIRSLRLSLTIVGDDGISHVKGMKELMSLHLTKTKVTDACLAHLIGLPKLRLVCVAEMEVSEAAIREFAKVRPDVHVIRKLGQ